MILKKSTCGHGPLLISPIPNISILSKFFLPTSLDELSLIFRFHLQKNHRILRRVLTTLLRVSKFALVQVLCGSVPCSGPMVGKVVGGLDLFSGGDSYSVNLTWPIFLLHCSTFSDHVVFCILYILGPLGSWYTYLTSADIYWTYFLALYLWLQTATDYTGLPVYRTLLIINHQTFYSCTLTMDVNPRKNVYGVSMFRHYRAFRVAYSLRLRGTIVANNV